MGAFVGRHRIVAFVVVAYAVSWADWIPLAVAGANVSPGGSVTHFPGLLGPAIAAFFVTALADGWIGVRSLASRLFLVTPPLPRFLAYTLSPLAFLVLAAAIAAVLGRWPAVTEFAVYSGLPRLPLWTVITLVLVFNGFGEETGWRGFALSPLQQRFGPLGGTLVVALIWAGWHVPSFWIVEGYRSLGVLGLIFGFGLGILSGAIVLSRIANRTGGSILAASIWHAIYNMTSATAASRGVIGAVTTTCVMMWAAILLAGEWRRRGSSPSLLAA